jgi:hypothetical protein
MLSVALLCPLLALAEDKPAAPQMSAEQMKMMEAMQKAMTPGPQHAAFASLVGKFKADMKFRTDANSPEQASTGEAVNELVFGGRFVKSEYSGDMSGQPFKGVQFLGYNNTAKTYQCVWMDDMSTAIMTSEGTGDASSITLQCTFACPLINGPRKLKMTYAIKNADEHTFEMYDLEGGKEFKMMTIHYTRVK